MFVKQRYLVELNHKKCFIEIYNIEMRHGVKYLNQGTYLNQAHFSWHPLNYRPTPEWDDTWGEISNWATCESFC